MANTQEQLEYISLMLDSIIEVLNDRAAVNPADPLLQELRCKLRSRGLLSNITSERVIP